MAVARNRSSCPAMWHFSRSRRGVQLSSLLGQTNPVGYYPGIPWVRLAFKYDLVSQNRVLSHLIPWRFLSGRGFLFRANQSGNCSLPRGWAAPPARPKGKRLDRRAHAVFRTCLRDDISRCASPSALHCQLRRHVFGNGSYRRPLATGTGSRDHSLARSPFWPRRA
jgi:hypothetical protein